MVYQKAQVQSNIYTTENPMFEGKEGFIGTFFGLYLNLSRLIASPDFSNEPYRVFYECELCISAVPDKLKRERIRKDRKELIKTLEIEYKEDKKIPPDTILSGNVIEHLHTLASIQALGDVTDYIDKHVGLSTKNKLGFYVKKNAIKEVEPDEFSEEFTEINAMEEE